MKKYILFICSLIVFVSCYTTKTNIGNYKQLEKTMQSYEYDQARQFYIISGLIPLGHPQPRIPNEPCMIRVKSKFIDYLLSVASFGILSSRTVEVFALQGGSAYPINNNAAPIDGNRSVANVNNEANGTTETANVNNTTSQSKTANAQGNATQNAVSQEKVYTPVRPVDHNAVAVDESVSSEERVTYENPNFKVGETVFYMVRDKVYSAIIISFKGSDIAVVEMENGAMIERYLKDLVKAKQ